MPEPKYTKCPECGSEDIENSDIFGGWGCWDCQWTEMDEKEEKSE